MIALHAWNPARWSLRNFTRAVLVVQALVIFLRFDPELSTNGDNARYFLLGASLATGQGYRAIEHPDRPTERQYPPGFPAMIALTGGITGNPAVAKTMVAVLALCSTLLLSRLLGRSAPGLARPVVALSALSPLLCEYSAIIMSEVPYLCATLLALVALSRYERHRTSGALATALAASILPLGMRTAGVAFCAAYVIHALWSRRWVLAAGHTALALAYTGMLVFMRGAGGSYLSSLVQADPYTPSAGTTTAGGILERVAGNVTLYTTSTLAESLIPLVSSFAPIATATASILCAVLALAGIATSMRGPLRPMSLYLLAYAAVLFAWPSQWSGTRFVAPVVPLLHLMILAGCVYVATTAVRVLNKLRNHRPDPESTTSPRTPLVAAWVLTAAIALASTIELSRPAAPILTPDWQSYYDCSNWLRTHAKPGSVVMCRSPALSFVRSGQPSMLYPFTADHDEFMRALRTHAVRYVILDSFVWSGTSFRYILPVVRSFHGNFQMVYASGSPPCMVLEVRWP